ncbi:putative defensin, invertebrate/fungal, knottin, scorpion toxin-like superfamily [Septoria linicola]|nr:putative defensin, invertebrate/fungal, knottin, scorpion toxin-like superfamily [Septoria linicola]
MQFTKSLIASMAIFTAALAAPTEVSANGVAQSIVDAAHKLEAASGLNARGLEARQGTTCAAGELFGSGNAACIISCQARVQRNGFCNNQGVCTCFRA